MPRKRTAASKQGSLEDRILDDVLKAGLPLEAQVTNQLEKAGWGVANQVPYLDSQEQKTRTIDMMAANWYFLPQPAKPRYLVVSLLVECKHGPDKAWVFYTRPRTLLPGIVGSALGWHFAEQLTLWPERAKSLATIILGTHQMWPEFDLAISHCISFLGDKEGHEDPAYTAFNQVTKATKHHIANHQKLPIDMRSDMLAFHYPVVVTDSPLFKITFTAPRPKLSAIRYIQYEFTQSVAVHPNQLPEKYVIDIVSSAALTDYFAVLAREAENWEARPFTEHPALRQLLATFNLQKETRKPNGTT